MTYKVRVELSNQFADGDIELEEVIEAEYNTYAEAYAGALRMVNRNAWMGCYVVVKINGMVALAKEIEEPETLPIVVGAVIVVVKGKKYPIGMEFKVLKIIYDSYNSRSVVSALGLVNGKWVKVNIDNCEAK